MAFQALQPMMSGARERAQAELDGRVQKLRRQRDLIKNVLDGMVRGMEMATSRAASTTNSNEFFRHFVAASVSMDRMYTKMVQIEFLLQADGFGVDPDYLRAPMAITYSFQDSNDWNYAEGALHTSGLGALPSISRPPSVTSLNLSVYDEMLGPRPALVLPQQSEPDAVALSPDSPVYTSSGGGHPGLAPPRALAYTSPGAPSAVGVPHGVVYPVPASPLACSLQPALTGSSGTQALLATSPPAYGDHEPQQQFMVPPGSGSLPELSASPTPGCESPEAQFMTGSGALPKHPSPLTLGYESPEAQFMSGRAKLASPPTPSYTSPGAQLTPKPKLTAAQMGPVPALCTGPSSELNLPPPTNRADVGHVEKMPGRSVTPHAKAPVRGAVPAAEGGAPPPVHSATTTPQKSAKGAIKKDVRDRGDVCSVLHEADQANDDDCQEQGKPGSSKASVSVPPGFTALHRQPECIGTGTKTSSADSSSSPQTLETAMAGSVKSQSPGSHKFFSIPPPDTSVIGSTQKVVLSFYKSPSNFWLQLESSGQVLENLLQDLAAYYKSSAAHEEFEAKVGMYCVAHYSVDDHWYRARIVELLPGDAIVSYVDFGNCNRVPLTHLCLLTEQFASLPVQALQCSVKGMVICFPTQVFRPGSSGLWPVSAVGLFRSMVQKDEIQLEATFYLRDSITGRFIVDVLGKTGNEPAVNLSQEFLTTCANEALKPPTEATPRGTEGAEPPAVGAPVTATTERRGPAPSAPAGAEACPDGMVSGPMCASAEAVLEGASVHVPGPPATAILATGPPPASTPPAIEPLVAPPSVTAAVVPKAAAARSPTGPSVRPPAGVPTAGGPSEGAVARKAPVTVHALPPAPPATVARPPPGAAHLPTIPPAVIPDGRNFTFILSVVVSPTDFYGQILTQNGTPKVMDVLQKQLNQKGSTSSPPPLELVTKGTFWICAYEKDNNWYRAQVLDLGHTPSGWRARVLYVDYGNRDVVKLESLRPLPANLARPPACAHRMALAMVCPPQGSKWNDRATDAFVSETGFKTVLVAEKKGQRQDGLETITDVVLWNRNGAVPVNVNRLLVRKKFAQLKSP